MPRQLSIHVGLDQETKKIVAAIPHKYRSAIIRGLLRAYKVYADKNPAKFSSYFKVMDDLIEIKPLKEDPNVVG